MTMPHVAFPFTALVGQDEIKDALILAAVNPRVQGVLLVGPKGTGKTTAVRGLADLLPVLTFSTCAYGCDPAWALIAPDRLCPDCLGRLAQGLPIAYEQRQAVVELPLNATLDDVVGGANARLTLEQQRLRFEPGILAHAHQNILYIDEINLLPEEVIDAILDAAATGYCVVRRGRLSTSYPARFVLVGSMNPEMGWLRPQIIDRIGLRVFVEPLAAGEDRLALTRRVRAYQDDAEGLAAQYAGPTQAAAASNAAARALLPLVGIDPAAEEAAIRLIMALEIESHRTEIVLFETARAYAAVDERTTVTVDDLLAVAPLVLRQRRSSPQLALIRQVKEEEDQIRTAIAAVRQDTARPKRRRSPRPTAPPRNGTTPIPHTPTPQDVHGTSH
jgi:magnesium chelatase subunit I